MELEQKELAYHGRLLEAIDSQLRANLRSIKYAVWLCVVLLALILWRIW